MLGDAIASFGGRRWTVFTCLADFSFGALAALRTRGGWRGRLVRRAAQARVGVRGGRSGRGRHRAGVAEPPFEIGTGPFGLGHLRLDIADQLFTIELADDGEGVQVRKAAVVDDLDRSAHAVEETQDPVDLVGD